MGEGDLGLNPLTPRRLIDPLQVKSNGFPGRENQSQGLMTMKIAFPCLFTSRTAFSSFLIFAAAAS